MPIYEYECKKCNEIAEIYQKVGDRPCVIHVQVRPESNCLEPVRKVVSKASFELRGDGWYRKGWNGHGSEK